MFIPAATVFGNETLIQWPHFSGTLYTYNGPPPTEEFFDDCTNPKMWAQWFREFLTEHLSRFVKHPVQFAAFRKLLIRPRCRSGPLRIREWKMKLWIQAL